jgi:hypothetical protein
MVNSSQSRNYLGLLLIFLVTVATVTRYADYVWAKNSMLTIYGPCDPETESCFLASEDMAWTELQLEPYKKIEIKERYAPACLQEHTCETFSCNDLTDCTETTCSEDTLEEGEFCVDKNYSDEVLE